MSRTRNNCQRQRNRATRISVLILAGVVCAVLVSVYVFGGKLSMDVGTIRMAAILFRHGEKNPTSFYPKDPYATHDWPGGLGALTMKGSLQAYNLGKHLRLRYSSILPNNGIYSQNDIHILSSSAERCIMSAQALLAGLLPPSEENSVLPIPWQPIPVIPIPRLEDTLIAQKKPCAKYDKILAETYTTPDLSQLNAANAELYHNLTLFTEKTITNVLDVELLYNTLKAEEDAGLKMPTWTEGIYPERLLQLAERSYQVFTETELMKRIKGGALIGDINAKMMAKAEATLHPDRRLFLYSGHDVTLVNVMNSMDILYQTSRLPDYASALVFELHEPIPEHFEVRMVYYSDSKAEFPTPISIPECSSPCSLENFTQSVGHLLFDNYDEICENPKKC